MDELQHECHCGDAGAKARACSAARGPHPPSHAPRQSAALRRQNSRVAAATLSRWVKSGGTAPQSPPIELLVMPRFEANANKLFNFLNDYIENQPTGAARWQHCTGRTDLRGVRPGHYDDSATVL